MADPDAVARQICYTIFEIQENKVIEDLVKSVIENIVQEAERRVWEEAASIVDSKKTPNTRRANTWSCRLYWLAGEFRHRDHPKP